MNFILLSLWGLVIVSDRIFCGDYGGVVGNSLLINLFFDRVSLEKTKHFHHLMPICQKRLRHGFVQIVSTPLILLVSSCLFFMKMETFPMQNQGHRERLE